MHEIQETWEQEALRETVKTRETVYRGKIFNVEVSQVTLPNGKIARRDVVRHRGAVCVLPLLDDGRVMLVRQWRAGYGGVTLEIPAGKLDEGETDPLAACKRELREEIGAHAGKWTYLGEYYGSPAILDEKIHMYLAEDLTFGETHPDFDEFLVPEKIPLSELKDLCLDGKIPDGKTQAAALRVYLMKNA